MKLKIAEYAGTCMGVDLALKKLDETISNAENNLVVTIGPIIHNPQVLKEYEKKNVQILENIDKVEKSMHVLIRAHGIPKDDEEKLRNTGAKIFDATCPKVKKAQLAVKKSTSQALDNTVLLLYGEEEHPEVRGLVSYSEVPYLIFDKPKEILSKIQELANNFILVSQTTQDKEIYDNFSKNLVELSKGKVEILDTICDATQKRQEAVRKLAPNVDSFVIIGGRTSGNTRRLAEIAASYKIPTFYIETASELQLEEFKESSTIGLTAGASTPNKYIEEVKVFFEENQKNNY